MMTYIKTYRDHLREYPMMGPEAALMQEVNELRAALNALNAAPQAIITTSRYSEKEKVGGCQLHNLQCSYPVCEKDTV